jgi:hypothetical protein
MKSLEMEGKTADSFSTPKMKRNKFKQKLPWVPRVSFPKDLLDLETLCKSMLESPEFERAMNRAAKEFGKEFNESRMLEEIQVYGSKELDDEHLFGKVDQSLDPDENANYIHLSWNMLENIRKQPAPNSQLKYLACITAVHEVAHFILRTAFDLEQTPEKFKSVHIVRDFGSFVERVMHKNLSTGLIGLMMFDISDAGWIKIDVDFNASDLGTSEIKSMRLKRDYLDRVVSSKIWNAPNPADIDKGADFSGKHAICRYSFVLDRGIRGRCGMESR